MAVQKNEFFEREQEKIMSIHNTFSIKDKNGKVHCDACPYSLRNGYYCDCLFAIQIGKKERHSNGN